MVTSQGQILTCSIFIVSFFCVQGLQMSMNVTPGDYFCGRLTCWQEVIKDGSILTALDMRIYDVTQTGNKLKVASVSLTGGGLYVDPIKSNDINVTGSISRYQAELALVFRDDRDCLFGRFQCELDFVNVSGQIGVIHEIITPQDLNNGCDCCATLTLKSKGLEQELTRLESRLEDVIKQLSSIQNLFNSTEGTAGGSGSILAPTGGLAACTKGAHRNNSGEIIINLWGEHKAICDMETDGGGWIVIQRRVSGDMNFYKNSDAYKKGFGALDGNFWIGNDIIHNLTSQGYNELRIELELEGRRYFAHYFYFSVLDESSQYQLSVSGYSGTAGDGMRYSNGMTSSTFDQDNTQNNCGVEPDGMSLIVPSRYTRI